ncbi:MAG: C-GCAxxG-C-C family protein, partial [Desulfatiglandales bacterium]|nr:C-GCAxxG-C-C family protein [Desulfatiglandales bacterium]
MKAAGGEKVAQKAIELAREGFCYSQILVALSLAHQRKTNRDLIRAMEGLKGGLGFSDKICGSLTGAVCLLGLYAWRGSFSEKPDPRLDLMVLELIERFEEKIGEKYGGIDCDQITEE